jgi:hypothetical protein
VIIDIMANRPWSGVEVFVNAHNGTFNGPVLYPTMDTPADMAIADLTGNGRNERVVVHNGRRRGRTAPSTPPGLST